MNLVNSDVWSYRRVAKTAAKLEHHGGSVRKVEKRVKTARKVEKKLKPAKRIVKQLKPSKKRVVKGLKHAAKQANKNNNNDNQNKSNQKRISQDLQRAMKDVADADRYLPANHQYRVQGRGLEDDEEVFGREYYDLLDARDIFDDLD